MRVLTMFGIEAHFGPKKVEIYEKKCNGKTKSQIP